MNTLFNYFKLNDGLPNQRGPLSSFIGSQAISSANIEVEAELARSQTSRKARTTGVNCVQRTVEQVYTEQSVQQLSILSWRCHRSSLGNNGRS